MSATPPDRPRWPRRPIPLDNRLSLAPQSADSERITRLNMLPIWVVGGFEGFRSERLLWGSVIAAATRTRRTRRWPALHAGTDGPTIVGDGIVDPRGLPPNDQACVVDRIEGSGLARWPGSTASVRIRSGLSPAATRSLAVVSNPTPNTSSSSGALWRIRGRSSRLNALVSSRRYWTR